MAKTLSHVPKKYLIYNLLMSNPLQVISVILVIRCQSKFLLVQRSEIDDIFPGFWQNMGGKIEVGETVEKAIAREMMEEVGLELESTPVFLHSYSWKKDDESSGQRISLTELSESQREPDLLIATGGSQCKGPHSGPG